MTNIIFWPALWLTAIQYAIQILVLAGLSLLICLVLFANINNKQKLKHFLIYAVILFSAAKALTLLYSLNNSKYILLSNIAMRFGALWIFCCLLETIALFLILISFHNLMKNNSRIRKFKHHLTIFLLLYVLVIFSSTLTISQITQVNISKALDKNISAIENSIINLQDKLQKIAKDSAYDKEVIRYAKARNYWKLSQLLAEKIKSSDTDFILFIDQNGLTKARAGVAEFDIKEISQNSIIGSSADKKQSITNITTFEWINSRQILIESASPLEDIGIIYTGYVLDNTFADKLKEYTGSDLAIFAYDTQSATTITGVNNKLKLNGTVEENEKALQIVLEKKEKYTGLSRVLHKEYYAVYSPIINYQDEPVGMIFTGYPSILLYSQTYQTLKITHSILLIVLIISSALFVFARKLLRIG